MMSQIFSPEMLSFLAGALVLFIFLVVFSIRKGKKIKIANRIQVDREKAAIDEMIKEIEIEESIVRKEDELTWLQKKQRELQQSNTGITLPIYLTILSVSMLLIFLIVYKIMGIALISIPFSFLGLMIPEKIVKSRLEKNIENFNSQLVKALRRMASVMRSGGSLKQALVDVSRSRSMPVIVRLEFKKVLTDVEYGASIEEALYKLYERTGSKDVQYLAIAVEIQRQLGGNIAQIFDTISQSISNRNLMESDVRATLAQVSASSTILSLMPFGLCTVIYIISPDYFDALFLSFTGRLIFLLCFSFILLGMFIIKKMSKLEL